MKDLKGLLNISRKAGYLIIGGENIEKHTQKMFVIVLDEKSGNSLKREMTHISNERKIPLLFVQDLEKLIGIENCKAVALKNKALSEEIIKIIKGE